jgi:FeS assembly SUF system regulator
MLKMSKLVDYGIVLLTYMGTHGSAKPYNAKDLAEATALPVAMVGKILKAFTRGGLLRSQLGAKGGYSLMRNPEQVSVADIVVALEGPIALTECLSEQAPSCVIQVLCPTRNHWKQINRTVREALDGCDAGRSMRRHHARRRVPGVTEVAATVQRS